MAKNVAIKELDGEEVVHFPGIADAYVLCGFTMDGDDMVASSEGREVRKAVTCDQCIRLVEHCRSLRLPRKRKPHA